VQVVVAGTCKGALQQRFVGGVKRLMVLILFFLKLGV